MLCFLCTLHSRLYLCFLQKKFLTKKIELIADESTVEDKTEDKLSQVGPLSYRIFFKPPIIIGEAFNLPHCANRGRIKSRPTLTNHLMSRIKEF